MIQIVLLKSVEKLGHVGDVVSVKPGYAKNFLVPSGIGLFVNKKILSQISENKEKLIQQDTQNIKKAKVIAEICNDLKVSIFKNVFQGTRIYGSVSAKEVAEMVVKNACLLIRNTDQSHISAKDVETYITSSSVRMSNIKEIGEYQVTINVYADVKFSCNLEICEQ